MSKCTCKVIQKEENHIGVSKDSGNPVVCKIASCRPLPCLVIVIHGVNDIGEAFQNLDEGICSGLNQRLGRTDIVPNTWKVTGLEPEHFMPRITITEEGYSPTIPFFWGYRPVDKEEYKKDQLAYYNRLEKEKPKDPEIPYDSYWQERNIEIISENIKTKKINVDKFNNWIDELYQRNGGPFSDATTCIPDMYGPGLSGETNEIAKLGSSPGAKAYDNPHRIYLAFAAHRLANLIKKIREETQGQDIPINIVAHSQGTIITMLANMILARDQVLPADCVILAHSPYAFDITILEQFSKEFALGMQSNAAREQTFINFVKNISEGKKKRKIDFDVDFLLENGVISPPKKDHLETYITQDGTSVQYDRLGVDQELFYRNNFGKVYNYFSPNDHVVSLRSVQGMGWQGIQDKLLAQCHDDGLRQRIFSEHYSVGNDFTHQKLAIPLESYYIVAEDYPAAISSQDYQQRVTRQQFLSQTIALTVSLTQQQLESLKTIEQFKRLEGQFISGHYADDSGRSIRVQYQPSNNEFLKKYPLASYKKLTADELDKACFDTTKENQKNDPVKIPSSAYLYSHRYQNAINDVRNYKASEYCNTVSTGGIQTASYDETRTITGEKIPEPFIYQVDKASEKSQLSRAIHYNDLFNNGAVKKLTEKLTNQIIERPEWLPLPDWEVANKAAKSYRYIEVTDQIHLKRLQVENKWDREVNENDKDEINHFKVEYITVSIPDVKPHSLLVTRHLTKEELQQELTHLVDKEKDTSSHHSGITMNKYAPKHVMAYDLAIGLIKNITPEDQTKLQQWRQFADWRSPENPDEEALAYMTKGILPPKLKRSMNYPDLGHMPKTVINQFFSFAYTETGQKMQQNELDKEKYTLLSSWPNVQYPLPNPDFKTR